MTPAQLLTFKTHILANALLTTAVLESNHTAIADHYNAAGTGLVYRPDVGKRELVTAVVWTEYAALAVNLQNCYSTMTSPDVIDCSNTNIRNGFGTIFAAANATRNNLIALAQRVPTKGEMVFMTGNVCSLYGLQVTPNTVALALEA